jgi:hypothetical protein
MPDNQHHPDWVVCGKTIRQLISELKTFENQDLEVRISTDDGNSFRPISIVTHEHSDDEAVRFCGLINCEDSEE